MSSTVLKAYDKDIRVMCELAQQKGANGEMLDASREGFSTAAAKLSARVLKDHGDGAMAKAVRREIAETLVKNAPVGSKSAKSLWSTFGRIVKVMNASPEHESFIEMWSKGDFTFSVAEGRKLIIVPKTLEKEIERLVKKYGAAHVIVAVSENAVCKNHLVTA